MDRHEPTSVRVASTNTPDRVACKIGSSRMLPTLAVLTTFHSILLNPKDRNPYQTYPPGNAGFGV